MYYQSGSVPTLEIDNDWYKPSHIENGLWLGDGTDSRNRNTLKMLEIRSIVKVMPFPPPEFVDDFKYLWIQVSFILLMLLLILFDVNHHYVVLLLLLLILLY
eukprot:TRINITY_DN986_c0_g1_i1.p1 TRINITY_DN986_c0_g1~~TRINITY_DN986_c0_g1_i1.p1  ORF type:complete len:102 (+),score=10.01 TRINITY_DN986_c0_g1_i1:20-325(+)